jgi:hypothetical protein
VDCGEPDASGLQRIFMIALPIHSGFCGGTDGLWWFPENRSVWAAI